MPRLVAGWAACYGAVQVWFAAGHEPTWRLPTDLLISHQVAAVACLASAAVVVGLVTRPRSRLLLGLAWAAAAGWVASCALFLLDVVGGLLPGLGIPFDLPGMLSRLGGITGAVLLGATALAYQRQLRPDCLRCSRSRPWQPMNAPPRWALVGAWIAVFGCGARLAAQAVIGFGTSPFEGGASIVLFEGGFLLAGTALPLLLVHRPGRLFPRWMLLWPGAGLGVGITAYFGVGLIQMIAAVLNGQPVYGDDVGQTLPESFFWVAVPSYLVWGAGLVVATYGYYLRTRRPCAGCGR